MKEETLVERIIVWLWPVIWLAIIHVMWGLYVAVVG